ncbi:MAG: hypothetical protein HUJ79_07300, partial [Firmicutes bacterium]|nr:hypothetical protein [Bacillota bacterium]
MSKKFENLFKKTAVWTMALVVLLGCSLMVTGCGSGSESGAGDEPTAEDSIYGNEALGIDPAVDEALAGYRNIAIYGLDSNHNSDIIMVFSLHKDSNKAKVFAIYDKTLVKSGEELMPLSEVYSQGMETSLAAINRTFDLNVYEAVAFDRPTIKKIVQLVHGPEIDLPEGDGGMTPEEKATRDETPFEALFLLAQKAETEQNLEVFEQVADDMESNMNKNRMTGLLEDIAKHEIE